MDSKEVRNNFLKYFESNGHRVVPSDSLIPSGDPTLLFTSAGMVQFKDQFLGKVNKGYSRAVSCQKCFRTSDIEQIGLTIRHLTFFEMLGNFSFGDYFKGEAIPWAWEFLTSTNWMGLPKDKLYVSIYKDDDEAGQLWSKIVEPSRIIKLGDDTNFWTMGPTGPCGPCSEIIYDRGEKYGCKKPDCGPACSCDRWLEVWNNVFTQYDRQPDGTLKPLPKKNIDTGMGLERLTTLVQNVESCFMTDLFKPIMIETVNLLGINVPDVDIKELRIIADHVRSTTMLCSDGIVPSNEGRGYVLRRILRRAVRQGKMLASAQKVELKPFVYKLAGFVAQHMKPVYPDIETHREQITSIVKMEEEKFLETLDTGTEMLEQVLRELSSKGNKIIPGSEVFKLYDTYGFPADLTNDIAVENGFTIDTEGFDKLVTSSRELARSAWKGSGKQELGVYKDLYTKVGNTKFVGYETIRDVTEIVGLVSNNVMVDAVSKGSEVEVILKETPFYAEQGGQIGDTGIIIAQDGYGAKIDIKIVVSDTQKMVEGLVVHRGKVVEGTARIGEKVEALVDSDRRKDIQRNHTATHLLHRALRQTLGLHVVQSGSLVTNERLRFDFAHPKALSGEQIESLELIVNNAVLESYCVNTSVTTLEKAIKDGVMALFGEKYGANVRVVKVGKVKVDCEESKASDDCFSMELCGGTHIKNTGEIGLFKILSESSVAAGTRRIEAITGHSALKYVVGLEKQQYELAELLHTQPQQLNQKLVKVITENKALEKKVEELESKLAGAKQGSETTLITSTVNGIKLVTDVLSGISAKALGEYGDRIRKSIGSGIVVVGSVYQDKPFLVVQITKDLVDKGVNANTIIKDIAKEIGGSGGGKPDFAQAGGKNVDGLKTAVDKAGDAVKSLKF